MKWNVDRLLFWSTGQNIPHDVKLTKVSERSCSSTVLQLYKPDLVVQKCIVTIGLSVWKLTGQLEKHAWDSRRQKTVKFWKALQRKNALAFKGSKVMDMWEKKTIRQCPTSSLQYCTWQLKITAIVLPKRTGPACPARLGRITALSLNSHAQYIYNTQPCLSSAVGRHHFRGYVLKVDLS